MATSLLFGGLITTSGGVPSSAAVVGAGFEVEPSDLAFILKQIQIAENHVANTTEETGPCGALVGMDANEIPEVRLPFGLRTVTGVCNHLEPGTEMFGASDTVFPRMTDPVFEAADNAPPQFGGQPTTYDSQGDGSFVFDADPRMISNLIVDQTFNNPAAVAASGDCSQPDANGNCPIGAVAPDEGLSAPFNSMFTFFGQFFDHGLDLVNKGGDGTVFIPLQSDDPLYDETPGAFNMLTLTRGSNVNGVLTDDNNQTTSYVDQNQTYTSHPSHQVFLRAYEFTSGAPLPTGLLLDGAVPGNIANWAEVKTQAAQMGIALTDLDVGNVPLLATDPYGHFIPGPNGFPQVLFPDGPDAGTAPDAVEGNPGSPISVAGSLKANHAFLDDIAHNAAPAGRNGPLTPDGDNVANDHLAPLPDPTTYDDELLDAHFITGDGRGNENIGLTAVHTIFHLEHNRLAEEIHALIQTLPVDVQAQWETLNPATGWAYGERLFQASRFVTEMQYQHLVFEEFARTLAPSINAFAPDGINFQSQLNPAITAEFAHAVYRFGHSMLTEQVRRTDPATGETYDITLFDGFLNPLEFNDGPNEELLDAGAAAGGILQGASREVGNEIDEFVTEVLRNQLLGRPLDLATLNLARGRSEGLAPLNVVRAQLYNTFGHSSLAPYGNWDEFGVALRNEASLVNFVAAYGTHPLVQAETTIERRRAAANAIVYGIPFAGALTNPGHPDGIGDNLATPIIDESSDDTLAAPASPGALLNPNDPEGFGDDPNTFPNADESFDDVAADPGDPGIDLNPNDPLGFGDDPNTVLDEGLDDTPPTPASPGSVLNPNDPLGFGDDPATTEGGDESVDDTPATLASPGTLLNPNDPGGFGDNPATSDESVDDILPPADASDFIFGLGDWAGMETGLNTVDLWMGGLAEAPAPFGGMLGSTFNWVFEIQLEGLQNADRFYYLERLDGLNLLAQLEGNSFAEIIMRNTTARALPSVVFNRPGFVFDIADGDEPGNPAPGQVIDDPATTENETNMVSYLSLGRIRYSGGEHIIWNGSETDDSVISGIGDDTFWGNGGNDRFEGGAGNDAPLGGEGDDILTDTFGDDVIKGGPGHDVITGGPGFDLLQGNHGDDFIVAGNDFTETFGGDGDDIMFTGDSFTEAFAGLGDDWIEGGGQLDLLVGDENNQFQDDPNGGHDVIIGGPGDDDYDAEGGDDVMVADVLGTERLEGMLGFDWVTYRGDPRAVDADMRIPLALPPQVIELRDRFDKTEAMSGWNKNDKLRGDDRGCTQRDFNAGLCLDILAEGTVVNNELTQAGIDRILNLRDFLDTAIGIPGDPGYVFDDGNILLGGLGNDEIEGRGADDIIDGDRWLNVQLLAGGTLYTSMKQFQAAVVNGSINPGTIDIVRTLEPSTAGPSDCSDQDPLIVENCDTAVFTGAAGEYVFEPDPFDPLANWQAGDLITVTHIPDAVTGEIGPDGIDTLVNIERFKFLNNTPDVFTDDVTIDPFAVVDFSVDPASVDFGTRSVGAPAVTRVITVTNDGEPALVRITNLELINEVLPDHPPMPFAIEPTSTCTVGTILGLDQSCTIVVSFATTQEAPGAPDTADAYLNPLVISVAGGFPASVDIIGTSVDNTPATGTVDVVALGLFATGQQLTIDPAGLVDPDGVPDDPALFDVQWVTAAGDPVGTGAPFTIPASAANQQLRAIVSFTDDNGVVEGPFQTGLTPVIINAIVGTNGADGTAAAPVLGTGNGDLILLLGGADFANSGGGDDIVDGGAGADTINLGAGNDRVIGGPGNDNLAGQGGNDTFVFTGDGDGFDTITGGAGLDTIVAEGPGPVIIGLITTPSLVEAITGAIESAPITIAGNGGANILNFTGITLTNIDAIDGGGGADQITGSAGVDVIIGNTGNDTLNGGNGNDTFRFGTAFGTDLITGFDFTATGGQDVIRFAPGTVVNSVTLVGTEVRIATTQGTVRIAGAGAVANITLNADYFIG